MNIGTTMVRRRVIENDRRRGKSDEDVSFQIEAIRIARWMSNVILGALVAWIVAAIWMCV